MSRKHIKLLERDWTELRGYCKFEWSDENKVKAKLREFMKVQGGFLLYAGTLGGYGKNGVDQVWLLDGYTIAIEVKWDVYERDGATVEQTQYLKDAEQHGAVSMVIDRNNFSVLERFARSRSDWYMMRVPLFLHYSWAGQDAPEFII